MSGCTLSEKTPEFSPEIVEYAKTIKNYRKDVRKLTGLCKDLETSDAAFVNLFDVLQTHGITDRTRIASYIGPEVQKAVYGFVANGIHEVFEQFKDIKRSSPKNVVTKILENKFKLEISTHIARATVEFAIRGNECIDHVKDGLLAQLLVVWGRICVPLIEGEQASLKSDGLGIHKLIETLKRALEAIASKTPSTEDAFKAFRKSVAMKHHHVLHRISVDPWFKSHELVPPTAVFACQRAFEEYFNGTGRDFKARLVEDEKRIAVIVKSRVDHECWYATTLTTIVTDTMGVFQFRAPSYNNGVFMTESGRVYATYTNSAPSCRCLPVIQTWWALHDMIKRGWLPVHSIGRRYSIALVESELQLYNRKIRGVVELFTDALVEMGIKCADLESVLSTASTSVKPDLSLKPRIATSSVDEHEEVARVDRGSETRLPTTSPDDTLTLFRDKSSPFLPLSVHWHSIVEYLVIHFIGSTVSEAIDSGRGACSVNRLSISNDKVANFVSTIMKQLVLANTNAYLSATLERLSSIDSLKQTISIVVKKVLRVGREALTAANTAGVAKNVVWTVLYNAQPQKQAAQIDIGYGVNDPMLYLVFNLCSRLKGFLDANWPLPVGVTWVHNRPRAVKIPI